VWKLEPPKAKEKSNPKRTIDLRDHGEENMFLVRKIYSKSKDYKIPNMRGTS
jgi:hypothetical protein